MREMLRELVDSYCAGSTQSLLLALIRREKLSEEQLLEVKRLADHEPLSRPRKERP